LNLDETLWVYRTTFKTSIGMIHTILCMERLATYQWSLTTKHFWILKTLNYDLKVVGERRESQMHEL